LVNIILSSKSSPDKIKFMGGKASNLYKLSQNNINVPSWFCISLEVFENVLELVKDDIEKFLPKIDYTSTENINNISKKIRNLFTFTKIPDEYLEEIEKEIASLDKNKFYAVRSSASEEDSEKNSFAGQLDTFLFIKPDSILKYIKKCWASAYSQRILLYLNTKNKNPIDTKVSVIVQEMVNSKVSGVMFLANPMGSLNEIVINAGYGLGEGIVSDIVESDTYLYDKTKKTIESIVNKKESKIVFNSEKEEGTIKFKVSENLKLKSALSENQINDLVQIGKKIENIYTHYQDIEFAIDDNDIFYITQTRPITTIPRGEKNIFDNSNIVESYPNITLPLSFSYVRACYEVIFRNLIIKLGVSRKKVYENDTVFKNMIAYIDGRVYYNLSNWYKMFSLIPCIENYVSIWEDVMGISDKYEIKISILHSLKQAPRLINVLAHIKWYFLTLDIQMKNFKTKFNSVYSEFWNKEHNTLDNHTLSKLYNDTFSKLMYGWEITLVNDGFAFIFSSLLKLILKKAGFAENLNIFNDLFCGEEDLESVKPVRLIVKLAEIVRNDKNLLNSIIEILDNKDDFSFDVFDKQNLNFSSLVKDYISNYGDRALSELKLETRTFRDNPKELLKLISSYANSDITLESMKSKENDIRKNTEKTIFNKLKFNPLLFIFYKLILSFARRSVKYRESSRLDRARAFGIVRKIFDVIGGNFYKENIISSPSDIYYLTSEEVFGYIHGTYPNNSLTLMIDERKKLNLEYQNKNPEERIILQGNVYSNFIPQKKDLKNEARLDILKGIPCSQGIVTGEAIVIKDPLKAGDVKNKILVAEMTDPAWVFLMISAKGLIVEKGSLLSHTAIIGRELGIPTVVNVKGATSKIKTGQTIKLDAYTGEVYLDF